MLLALGFRPVVTVRKKRQVYRFARGGFDLEACFDDVELVGPFVELEILAPEEQYEPAKAVLLATAADLGLTEKETRSYLGMVLEAQGKGG
jgi:adenylate cyclase class 2